MGWIAIGLVFELDDDPEQIGRNVLDALGESRYHRTLGNPHHLLAAALDVEPPPNPAGAAAVTRRLLDDWVPDVEKKGWWAMGSGMEGPGEPMTDAEAEWIAYVDRQGPG